MGSPSSGTYVMTKLLIHCTPTRHEHFTPKEGVRRMWRRCSLRNDENCKDDVVDVMWRSVVYSQVSFSGVCCYFYTSELIFFVGTNSILFLTYENDNPFNNVFNIRSVQEIIDIHIGIGRLNK